MRRVFRWGRVRPICLSGTRLASLKLMCPCRVFQKRSIRTFGNVVIVDTLRYRIEAARVRHVVMVDVGIVVSRNFKSDDKCQQEAFVLKAHVECGLLCKLIPLHVKPAIMASLSVKIRGFHGESSEPVRHALSLMVYPTIRLPISRHQVLCNLNRHRPIDFVVPGVVPP